MTTFLARAATVAAFGLVLASGVAAAQNTQILLTETGKSEAPLTPQDVHLEVDGHDVTSLQIAPLQPQQTQVALLIDDGLRTSVGRQLPDLKAFLEKLRPGTEVMIGYMQNGRVVAAQPFTTNYALAASKLRLPLGSPGLSASPYFCLSDFAKNWPRAEEAYGGPAQDRSVVKQRVVLMLTNGVDPYNGSVSPLNQNSPYVLTAISDAQKAGVAVYSIYYGDAGIRGGAANFSGQNYLNQVAEGTGGQSLYNMNFNPVSLTPYLDQFLKALQDSYVAGFNAPTERDLAALKVKTSGGVKVRAAKEIRPGNLGS